MLEGPRDTIARETPSRDPAKRFPYQVLCSVHASTGAALKVTNQVQRCIAREVPPLPEVMQYLSWHALHLQCQGLC